MLGFPFCTNLPTETPNTVPEFSMFLKNFVFMHEYYSILRIIPTTIVSLEPVVLSDKIPARSFASLIHRLVRLQLTSPLAYNIAQLFEPRLFSYVDLIQLTRE